MAGRIENADVAKSNSVIFIPAPRSAVSEGDNEISADILDIERRPTGGKTGQAEHGSFARIDAGHVRVPHLHVSRLEICYVQEGTRADTGKRTPFVNGSAGAVLQ